MRKGSLGRQIVNNWQLYLIIMPALLYLIIFNYLPMYGIQIAFRDYRAIDGITGSVWAGLKHFKTFFEAYYSTRLIVNTFLLNFYGLLFGYLAAVFACFLFLLFGGTPGRPVYILMYIFPFGTAALLYCCFYIVRSDARIDPLTGIGNRFGFIEFTDKLTRRKTGGSWAIVMIDMDHFKMINDTLGHREGDNALCDMAGIIKSCIKKSDLAARHGGDEFVLVIKIDNNDANYVSNLMGEVQAAVDRHNATGIRPFKLEISYGYDIFSPEDGLERSMNHIDGLMYKHKQERRRAGDRIGDRVGDKQGRAE